jgi:signal transduction histidine kinase/HAMP domain-containing protein
MRLSLKAKLTGLVAFLVLLVVLATSTVYVSNLTRQALAEVESLSQYVANQTYLQARTVLAQSRLPAGTLPSDLPEVRRFIQSRLAGDAGLGSLMESAVVYYPALYYVSITDSGRKVLAHNDPGEIGSSLAPAPPLRELLRAGLLQQLRVIYGRQRVYEVVLPVETGGQPLDVRVGISTVFMASQIAPSLRAALFLSAMVIALATFSAGILSFHLLRPLETISRGVDRLARGEYTEPLELHRQDEWGALSSKLNLLGEQMRGEKDAFLQLQDNLDQLFSKLSDGLMLYDKQDRLVLATHAVARFLGASPESLVHRPAAEIFTAPSPLHRLLSQAFNSRRSVSWQTVENPATNGEVPARGGPSRVAVNVQFVDEQGERVGCLVTLRDAGTRAEIEDQIDVTSKLAALARLTSGVAHEVKNPLNAMVLQLEVLKLKLAEAAPVNEAVKPQLEILSDEIQRLDRVVKTFLDFTRPVELHPAETDIVGLVREVFTLAEPHARQNHVRLVLASDGAPPPVRVDRDLMKQALLNLVLNGCQAMPAGGELKVTPSHTGDRLELEIADQGVGIPPEARQKIFSLFYTTKPGGSGVGLALTYRILQLHNGSIDFSSELNRGTSFRVSLPL